VNVVLESGPNLGQANDRNEMDGVRLREGRLRRNDGVSVTKN